MNYWTPHAWEIEKEGDKYIVAKWTNEVMRLSADGSLGIGGNRQPIEKHEFKTLEWAQLMLKFCQGLESQSITFLTTNSNFGWSTAKFNTSMDWKFANHSVVTIGQNGELLKIDLPFIVWQWFKLSKFTKFVKTLMWGERGKND